MTVDVTLDVAAKPVGRKAGGLEPSARGVSAPTQTNKGHNQRSKYVTITQKQTPESTTVKSCTLGKSPYMSCPDVTVMVGRAYLLTYLLYRIGLVRFLYSPIPQAGTLAPSGLSYHTS